MDKKAKLVKLTNKDMHYILKQFNSNHGPSQHIKRAIEVALARTPKEEKIMVVSRAREYLIDGRRRSGNHQEGVGVQITLAYKKPKIETV